MGPPGAGPAPQRRPLSRIGRSPSATSPCSRASCSITAGSEEDWIRLCRCLFSFSSSWNWALAAVVPV